MCWSAEVSFGTFLLSLACGVYLWQRKFTNDRWNAVFSIIFSLMQLLEGFIWLDIDDNSPIAMNRHCTHVIWPLVLLVPVGCSLGHDIEVAATKQTKLRLKKVTWFLFFLFCFGSLSEFFKTHKPTAIGAKGHLHWPELDIVVGLLSLISYPLGMSLPLLYMRPLWQGIVYSLTGPVSIALTLLYFGQMPGEFGSVWCHIANCYGGFSIMLPLFIKKSTHIKSN